MVIFCPSSLDGSVVQKIPLSSVDQRAASQGWPVHQWCYRETLEPHGWLTQAEVDRKRAIMTGQMWQTEYDLQEPSVQGRAIDPDAVDWTFDPTVGRARAAARTSQWAARNSRQVVRFLRSGARPRSLRTLAMVPRAT